MVDDLSRLFEAVVINITVNDTLDKGILDSVGGSA